MEEVAFTWPFENVLRNHPNPLWRKPQNTSVGFHYLDRAYHGLSTPDEIEAELKAKNLPPLATRPDPLKFDPLGETWWTLPMVAAWIVWRTPGAVRHYWDSYRHKWRLWSGPRDNLSRVPDEMVSGYRLFKAPEPWLADVLSRPNDVQSKDEAVLAHDIARQQLRARLQSGELVAEGIPFDEKVRTPIRPATWIDLDFFYRPVPGAGKRVETMTHRHTEIRKAEWPANALGGRGDDRPRFIDVRVRWADVVTHWRASAGTLADKIAAGPAITAPIPRRPRAPTKRDVTAAKLKATFPTGRPAALTYDEMQKRAGLSVSTSTMQRAIQIVWPDLVKRVQE